MKPEYEDRMDKPEPSVQEMQQHLVGWYDATINAVYWCTLPSVTALEAAKILSGVNPHDCGRVDDWLAATSWKDHSEGIAVMSPIDRRNLLRGLEGVGAEKPLCEWLQIAAEHGWRYDPWIDEYIEASGVHRVDRAASELLKTGNAIELRPSDEAQPQNNLKHETQSAIREKRRTWKDVASAYIVSIMQSGRYANAKVLFRELENRAGSESPFDLGTGPNRGSLFVREIGSPLSLKTLQNNMPALRRRAQG